MNTILLFNAIKINILNKKKYFYCHHNKKDAPFLKKLIQVNLIKGCKIITSKKIKIFLSYKNNQPLYKFIKLLYKPSHKFIINLKTLLKVNKYKNGTYLLFTNKGFITNYEAAVKKTGGILFCKLN